MPNVMVVVLAFLHGVLFLYFLFTDSVLVFFPREGKVIAAASLNADPVVANVAELLFQSKMPSASELR